MDIYESMILKCDEYLHQISRHYGKDCADASVCILSENGYLVNVAVEKSTGFESGDPQFHSEEQLDTMIAVLSVRRPEDFERRRVVGCPRALPNVRKSLW